MFRSLFTLVVVVILAQCVSNRAVAKPPELGKSFLPDAIRFVSATSQDKAASTLIFDNFVLATENGVGTLPTARTKVFSVANEVTSDEDSTVTVDVRGFVSTTESGSVSLLIHVAGKSTLVNLPKAITAAADNKSGTETDQYKQARAAAEEAGYSLDVPTDQSNDYFVRTTVVLPKGQPLQATIVVVADRLTSADSSALITIDSIDIELHPKGRGKKD